MVQKRIYIMMLEDIFALVTRPQPQNDALCEAIHEAGGRALSFPTIRIMPPSNSLLLNQQIEKIDQYHWVIFTSRHAVEQSAPFIYAKWPVFPQNTQIAVIGQATALAVKTAHLPQAIYPEFDWRSEGLLALPQFQKITQQKIAIITGENGRTVLIDTLKKRKAIVTNIIAYQRTFPQILPPLIREKIDKKINVSICTSNDIIQNLKIIIDKININLWQTVCQMPMVVVSKRMALFAKEMGIQTIFVAENPSLNVIIALLAKKKEQICQMKRKNPSLLKKEIGEI